MTATFGNGRERIEHPSGTVLRISPEGSPRFGSQARYAREVDVVQPSGLTATLEEAREVTLADPNDPLSLIAETLTVDINGRRYMRAYDATTRTATLTTPAGRQEVVGLDSAGRPVRIAPRGLVPLSLSYDADGRVSSLSRGTRRLSFVYDASGRVASRTDALSQTTAYAYDASDRITQVTLPDGAILGLTYDPSGRPTALVPPGRAAHAFGWTSRTELASYTPPGAVGNDLYAYDLDRAVTLQTNGAGQRTERVYDATTGRLSMVRTAIEDRSLTYDPNTGKLVGIRTPSQTVAYAYDGSLLISSTWTGEVVGTVSQVYDANMWMSERTAGGVPVNFSYDPDGLLISAGALSITFGAQDGLPIEDQLDQVVTTYAHDAYGDLVGRSVSTVSGASLYELSLARDDLGRVVERTETIDSVRTTRVYQYDQRGRLERVLEGANTVERYGYDLNGNRTFAASGVTGVYGAQDELQGYDGGTYTVDGAGRRSRVVRAGATTDYIYGALGHLRRVDLPSGRRIDYVIDGSGRRVAKKVDGVRTQAWLYADALRPVAELDGANALTARFVYGAGSGAPAYMIRDGVTYRMITDQLGSVRLVVDAATGAVAQRIDYDTFGRVTQDTNPGFQPFGFAGGLYDPDTGLVHFGARDYDARVGRWTSKDPLRFGGGDTNLYAYVGNDPVNYIDPTGRCRGGWDRISAYFRGLFQTLRGKDSDGVKDGIKDELRGIGRLQATDFVRGTRSEWTCMGCGNEPGLVARNGLRRYKDGRDDVSVGEDLADAVEQAGDNIKKAADPKGTIKDAVKDWLFEQVGTILPQR
ncbi:MAG: RHS repeat-associated core domain-containing protein [Myxococcota bacterium]